MRTETVKRHELVRVRGSGRTKVGPPPLLALRFKSGVKGHGWKCHHSSACPGAGGEEETLVL